jgi:hypothetical protein
VGTADGICESTHVGVTNFVSMLCVKAVHQTVAELQLRVQLEKWQVEVAA